MDFRFARASERNMSQQECLLLWNKYSGKELSLQPMSHVFINACIHGFKEPITLPCLVTDDFYY